MRIIRWFLILSSVAYWYSVFAMDTPLSPQKRRADISIESLQEELGLESYEPSDTQLEVYPPKILTRKFADQEVPLLVKFIIANTKKLPTLDEAVKKANEQLFLAPEIREYKYFMKIAQEIAQKFNKPWLYVATQIQPAPPLEKLITFSEITKVTPNEKILAIKETLQLNDTATLKTLLASEPFKIILSSPTYKQANAASLADLARQGKTDFLKIFLESGINSDLNYQGCTLLQLAYPHLETLMMLVKNGARNGIARVIAQLEQTKMATLRNNPLYTPLLSLLKTALITPKLNSSYAESNPLFKAARDGNLNLFKALIELGANVNYPIKTEDGTISLKELIGPASSTYPNSQEFIKAIEGK